MRKLQIGQVFRFDGGSAYYQVAAARLGDEDLARGGDGLARLLDQVTVDPALDAGDRRQAAARALRVERGRRVKAAATTGEPHITARLNLGAGQDALRAARLIVDGIVPVVAEVGADLATLARERVVLDLDGLIAFVLLSQLQLALRHPGNSGYAARLASVVARELEERVAITPALRAVAAAGWEKSYDGEES